MQTRGPKGLSKFLCYSLWLYIFLLFFFNLNQTSVHSINRSKNMLSELSCSSIFGKFPGSVKDLFEWKRKSRSAIAFLVNMSNRLLVILFLIFISNDIYIYYSMIWFPSTTNTLKYDYYFIFSLDLYLCLLKLWLVLPTSYVAYYIWLSLYQV